MHHILLLATTALAVLAGSVTTEAEPAVRHRVHPRALPPLSGTLRMAPGEFGASRRLPPPPPVVVRRRFMPAPEAVEVVRGGVFPQSTLDEGGGLSATERWATGGTGLRGLIGNTGNPFAGTAAWGTADSATTGIARAPRFATARRGLFTSSEGTLAGAYGERPLQPVTYDVPVYGSAPPVPFYGSGTPYSLSYYSSGSSAGPYGSPGGLGVYRSGSYGYGPRIIRLGGRHGLARRGCACGPRIVQLRRPHHILAR